MEVEDYRAFLMARLVEQECGRLEGRVLDVGRGGLPYRRLAPELVPDPERTHSILVSWSCGLGYVGQPDPETHVAYIVPPEQAVELTVDQWCTAYTTGVEIVPDTTYTVLMIDSDGGGAHPLGGATTWQFCDVNNDGMFNITDVSLIVSVMQGEPLLGTTPYAADQVGTVDPCVPELIVDMNDVDAALCVFQGGDYPTCTGGCPYPVCE